MKNVRMSCGENIQKSEGEPGLIYIYIKIGSE